MAGEPFQLGLPGALPPVPLSDDESPAKKARASHNKSRGSDGRGKTPGGGAGARGKEGGGGQSLTLDMSTLEQLLDQQCEKILQANRQHAQGLLDQLEQRQAARFVAIERSVEGVEYTVEGFEARLKAVEEKLQRGVPKDDAGRRRWTLVFGGWDQDTRRATILSELDQAFTTGPRRSVAMANIGERDGETEGDRKGRMHRIVMAFLGDQAYDLSSEEALGELQQEQK